MTEIIQALTFRQAQATPRLVKWASTTPTAKKKPIEQYDRKGNERTNNRPVGLMAPETDVDSTMPVLETKGQDAQRDQTKREFLAEWVRAVDQHGGMTFQSSLTWRARAGWHIQRFQPPDVISGSEHTTEMRIAVCTRDSWLTGCYPHEFDPLDVV
jgi:hypothetical protein